MYFRTNYASKSLKSQCKHMNVRMLPGKTIHFFHSTCRIYALCVLCAGISYPNLCALHTFCECQFSICYRILHRCSSGTRIYYISFLLNIESSINHLYEQKKATRRQVRKYTYLVHIR